MASSDSDPVLQKKASVMTLDEVINAGDEEAPKLLTEEPAAVEATITTDLLGDEAPKDKKSFGKRPVKSALIHLGIWLVMTAYIVAFGILGKGKAGYEFGMLVYVFISLRLLAQHVSMSNLIYDPIGKAWDLSLGKIPSKVPEKIQLPLLGGIVACIFIATSLGSPTTEYSTLVQRVQSIAGIIIMLGILFATSRNRKAIQWRVVIVGMFLQYLLALFILRTQLGVNVFQFISNLITTFLGFAYDGLAFIFGNVPKASFAVNVLPAIVFFCAFVSMIYYLGAMQYLVTKVAWVAVRLMDTSGSESVVAVASPFVGQGESALLVRPFVQYMTKSELHSTMTSGFATISGSVLLAYVGYTGNNPSSTAAILTSCVMSVPCSLLVSKLRYPETEESITRGKVRIPPSEEQDANVLHALGNGAATGMNLIILISGALVAIVALYSILNAFTGYLFDMIGIHNEIDGGIWVSLQFILSFVFTPFAFFIGIPPEFCRKAGEFIATKMAANEFVAYSGLRDYAFLPSPQANPDGSLISNGKFDIRTLRLLTFALCGFANFASIGIQIGCLGAIAPNRRKDLATLAFSAMLCGTMSTWITAAVAGALI